MVHTMHTMARVKNNTLSEHQTSEPNDREHGEAAIVADADVLTANTPDEAAELQAAYGATTDQIRIVPPGVDLHTFHPCDQPQKPDPAGRGPGEADHPLRGPDPAAQVTGYADPGGGRAPASAIRDRRDRLRLMIIGSPSGPDSAWSATLRRWPATSGSATW